MPTLFGITNAERTTSLYQMLPYLVTIAVLIAVSIRKKRESQPPAALGLPYFREER
jgi:simple sugar transport system permease protein